MDKTLVKKYINGECTHSEAQQVLEWFQTPEGQDFLDEEIDRDIWIYEEYGEYIEYPDLNSDRLFDRIQASATEDNPEANINRLNSSYSWKRAAAVILLVGVLSLLVSIYAGFWEAEKQIVETKIGQKKTLTLPDNSKIVLHSNSTLEYFTNFEKREVSLSGEAYFEVEHDASHPFVVFVDNSYVKVLGTKFVVSSYSGNDRVKVAVKSGKVELGSSNIFNADYDVEALEADSSKKITGKPIQITDNQVGVQGQDEKPFISDSVYSDELLDWTEGKMIFKNTPLTAVMREIENRYGVQFELRDKKLGDKKFTSSFDDESLSEVLNVLTLSLDITYKREGDKIYFSDR